MRTSKGRLVWIEAIILGAALVSAGGCPMNNITPLPDPNDPNGASKPQPIPVELRAAVEGDGTIEVDMGDAVTEYVALFDSGIEVTILAKPGESWRFVRWEGDVGAKDEEKNPLTIQMDADRTLTAVFIQQFELAVDIDGKGTVAVDDGDAAKEYTGVFHADTEVTILADPASGWRFLGWEGDVPEGSETENPLLMGVGGDTQLTAVFVEQFELTVDIEGKGDVLIETADGTETTESLFDDGTELTLTPEPKKGWTFLQWEGDVSARHEEDNPLMITIDDDLDITAVFVHEYVLTIEIEGEGEVDPPGGGFPDGSEVELTATPDEGCAFVEWRGDVPEGHEEDNPLVVVMDGDKDLTAVFRNPPKDGYWEGLTSQAKLLSFRVSNGCTTISDVKISYWLDGVWCNCSGTTTLSSPEIIDASGSFWVSGGSWSSTYVRVSGSFESDGKQAAGSALVWDDYCAGSASPTWTASWKRK